MMDIRGGKPSPDGFDQNRPWDYIFQALAKDENFWRTQVHTPALAWIASGSHGTPRTPAEQLASSSMQGGLSSIAPVMESDHGTKVPNPNNINGRRKRRKTGGKGGGEDGENPRSTRPSPGGKKGGSKGNAPQKCFAWNNGNAPCGDLVPGQQCAAKVKRLHRCTKCDSPGHPSRNCPVKD